MKFVIDAQLPPVMVRWLQAAGHEAVHVEEVGLLNADDVAIWEHAQKAGAAILTKDEDFAERAKGTDSLVTVVWLRIGNCSNSQLRAWFEPRLPGMVQIADEGGRVIEVI